MSGCRPPKSCCSTSEQDSLGITSLVSSATATSTDRGVGTEEEAVSAGSSRLPSPLPPPLSSSPTSGGEAAGRTMWGPAAHRRRRPQPPLMIGGCGSGGGSGGGVRGGGGLRRRPHAGGPHQLLSGGLGGGPLCHCHCRARGRDHVGRGWPATRGRRGNCSTRPTSPCPPPRRWMVDLGLARAPAGIRQGPAAGFASPKAAA